MNYNRNCKFSHTLYEIETYLNCLFKEDYGLLGFREKERLSNLIACLFGIIFSFDCLKANRYNKDR